MDLMTPQEIEDLFAAYDKAVANGTANTREWQDAINDAKKGIEGYTRTMRENQQALKSSLVGLGQAFADGKTGTSVFNDSIEAGATTLATWLSSKGPFGKAAALVVKATAAYVGAVNKQADALYKSFQELSRTGAIGHQGMQQVYVDMQKFGYGIKELDKFGALIGENSKDLANFGGTAIQGTQAFANLATELQHSPITKDLLNMGISVDEINKGAAGYIKMQVAYGQNQKTLGDQLAAGTREYIEELETMSRLTGQSRQQQEEKIADAQAEEAFNAKIRQLRKQEAAGDENARKQRIKLERANLLLEGDMRKQFIRGAAGDIAALGPLVNVAGEDLINAINDPNQTLQDVVGSITTGYKNLRDSGGDQLQMLNSFNDTFGNTLEYEQLVAKTEGRNLDVLADNAKANKKATDSTTKNMTEMEIAQRKARDNMQDFVHFGVEPVTKAFEILSKVVEWLTSWLPGAGRAKEQREMQKKTESKKTTQVGVWEGGKLVYISPEEADKRKADEAKGIKPTPSESKAPPEEGKGKGLTGKDINGLDRSFADAIRSAADEYFSVTGKQVHVASALRDSAKQQELYDAWISGKSKFPAGKPGTSKHEKGLAVDVDLAAANAMDSMGILGKYGLRRPVPGDPIHISAEDGFSGTLSGPSSGYKPDITMHGTETLDIMPIDEMGAMEMEQDNTEKKELLTAHLDTLDRLYNVLQKQNDVSTTLLRKSM